MEVAYGFSPSAFSVLSVGKVHTCARLLLGYNIQIRTDSLSLSLDVVITCLATVSTEEHARFIRGVWLSFPIK